MGKVQKLEKVSSIVGDVEENVAVITGWLCSGGGVDEYARCNLNDIDSTGRRVNDLLKGAALQESFRNIFVTWRNPGEGTQTSEYFGGIFFDDMNSLRESRR